MPVTLRAKAISTVKSEPLPRQAQANIKSKVVIEITASACGFEVPKVRLAL
jgi:hypothetical protein